MPGKCHAHVHPSRLLMPQSLWWTMSRSIGTRAAAELVVCWVNALIFFWENPTENQGFSFQMNSYFQYIDGPSHQVYPILRLRAGEGMFFLRHSMGKKRRIWNPETTHVTKLQAVKVCFLQVKWWLQAESWRIIPPSDWLIHLVGMFPI